jgi:hypothetical protein
MFWETGQKLKLHFVFLWFWYNTLSQIVKILTLESLQNLLKNISALSEYAECSQSLTDGKKIEIPFLYPGYNGKVKKPSHATVPLKL